MLKLTSAEHIYNSENVVLLPDIELKEGDECVILGLSGSGKSTLLHVLGGLLKPTRGSLEINGQSLYSLSESARDKFRGKNIGIIFQQMHLVDSLTVEDNIRLAQYMSGRNINRSKIKTICDQLEISDKLTAYTDELSQGQKQRVGIARAVVNEPKLILADEPTSSLDDMRAGEVIGLLRDQAKQCGAILVISTHDNRVKQFFGNTINLNELHAAEGVR